MIVLSLYENINTNKIYFFFIVKGKLTKITKSSFKGLLRKFSTNKDFDKLLGHYLAGLIEGDGSIIVPKTIRNQKGKLLYPFTGEPSEAGEADKKKFIFYSRLTREYTLFFKDR